MKIITPSNAFIGGYNEMHYSITVLQGLFKWLIVELNTQDVISDTRDLSVKAKQKT